MQDFSIWDYLPSFLFDFFLQHAVPGMDTNKIQNKRRTEMNLNSIENQFSYHLQFRKGQSPENSCNQNTNQ